MVLPIDSEIIDTDYKVDTEHISGLINVLLYDRRPTGALFWGEIVTKKKVFLELMVVRN